MSEEYDLVTIGAGSGGVRASRLAAGTYGAKVSDRMIPISNAVKGASQVRGRKVVERRSRKDLTGLFSLVV